MFLIAVLDYCCNTQVVITGSIISHFSPFPGVLKLSDNPPSEQVCCVIGQGKRRGGGGEHTLVNG